MNDWAQKSYEHDYHTTYKIHLCAIMPSIEHVFAQVPCNPVAKVLIALELLSWPASGVNLRVRSLGLAEAGLPSRTWLCTR